MNTTKTATPAQPRKRIFDVTSVNGATMHVEACGTEEAIEIARSVGMNVDPTTVKETT